MTCFVSHKSGLIYAPKKETKLQARVVRYKIKKNIYLIFFHELNYHFNDTPQLHNI